jgi:LacI family transcriptional regulator
LRDSPKPVSDQPEGGQIAVPAITITEVAARAGLSIKTVSRVLNNEPNVREKTRDRVLEAAKALDYQPNLSARSLAGARSFLIGLFFDNPSPAYVYDVQLGAASRCRASGYHLTIEPVDTRADDLEQVVRRIISTLRLDGVVLTPPVCDDERVLRTLEASGTPYVRMSPERHLDRAPRVGMDDTRAAYEMTLNLIDMGHVEIGFILGHPDHGATNLRYKGFVEAMTSRGLVVTPAFVKQGLFSSQSGFDCAEAMLSQPERPTAIFASNDDMALGVMAAANRLKLSVPDQLSVAGFDNTPAASTVWPHLSTVAQPIFNMASAACELLIGRQATATGDGNAVARLMDFEIIMRDSTRPPARTL